MLKKKQMMIGKLMMNGHSIKEVAEIMNLLVHEVDKFSIFKQVEAVKKNKSGRSIFVKMMVEWVQEYEEMYALDD